uniref:Uncharacterized protein n=1 Tax=Romanomermis culicivorax TaxID=13658 RepID=A0A915HM20_ROMCU
MRLLSALLIRLTIEACKARFILHPNAHEKGKYAKVAGSVFRTHQYSSRGVEWPSSGDVLSDYERRKNVLKGVSVKYLGHDFYEIRPSVPLSYDKLKINNI